MVRGRGLGWVVDLAAQNNFIGHPCGKVIFWAPVDTVQQLSRFDAFLLNHQPTQ